MNPIVLLLFLFFTFCIFGVSLSLDIANIMMTSSMHRSPHEQVPVTMHVSSQTDDVIDASIAQAPNHESQEDPRHDESSLLSQTQARLSDAEAVVSELRSAAAATTVRSFFFF